MTAPPSLSFSQVSSGGPGGDAPPASPSAQAPDRPDPFDKLPGEFMMWVLIVSELLAEVTPVLERVCESLELAKRAQAGVRANGNR